MMLLQMTSSTCRLPTRALVGLLLLVCVLLVPQILRGDEKNVLDRGAILESHDWWDNCDFDWYVENIR
jgi:hypothetical protein